MSEQHHTDSEHGHDRRSIDRRAAALTEDKVSLMIEESVADALAKHESRMILHIDTKFGQLHKFIADAFPDGDPHGHRIAHEKQIKSADAWDKFRFGLFEHVAKGGALLVIGYVALALWDAFKAGVHK